MHPSSTSVFTQNTPICKLSSMHGFIIQSSVGVPNDGDHLFGHYIEQKRISWDLTIQAVE